METPQRNGQDPLRLNMKIVQELLQQFLHDEIHAAGFSKGVVGISGGVDSAVSAFLCAESLGKENAVGVILPHATSSPESVRDAKEVVRTLGIPSETIDITPMVDAYCEQHNVTDRVRRGNVMARMRMLVLYDVSAREQALVIGTSNKTEIMLGYGTLHGDTACALNPLGDLYKSQVWQLAEHLGVPKRIAEKPPTADLWPGQTDEGELGFTYRQVDRLLYEMIDNRRRDDELVVLGFDRGFIDRVRTMVRVNQFKRRPPLIAKVSYRTMNVDFRYARDWGL
jgi:NAD+ synthase